MKVSCSKTDYICGNERDSSGTERSQGAEIRKVEYYYALKVQQRVWKRVEENMQADWNS